jgi:hypothetical protein
MRKRAFAGITVVLGVVIATVLNGGFPGFGTRNGSADENGSAEQVVASTETEAPGPSPATPQPEEEPKTEEEQPKKPDIKVLDILVDGHEYQISLRGKGYTTFPLERIVATAQATSGNEDGIRVRILRRDSARVVAWSRLYEALEDAGISKDAILMPHELFEGE